MKRNPQSGERKKATRRRKENRGAEDLEREESSLHDIGTGVWLHNPLTLGWSDSEGVRVNLSPELLGESERGKWRR